jgi:putative ABC transport system ATP-binding protein
MEDAEPKILNMALVELKNVHKTYRLGETIVPALRGLNLSLNEGEFTALIGASGSGKSTLLNLMGCLDTPDEGSILIANEEVTKMNEVQQSELRNSKIGFIFQTFNLVPVLDVFENIELPLLVRDSLSRAERDERVRKSLNDVGLSQFIHHMPEKLSGGQRQRVAIARALVTHPSLILADEPTANLDSVTAHLIIDLLMDLNQRNKVTFLFCSHDEKLIGRVGRVLHIQDGVILE